MTIRKEDVCSWYSNLAPASRIDFLSGFLRLLLPWELRFVGSCLEDLARRDFHVFREAELRANTMSVMQRISSLYSFTSDEFRGLLTISLALLHSTNVQCATLYSDVLIWNFELARELVRYDHVSREDVILLYNLAINHPAFTFDQRQTLCHLLQILKQIEVDIPSRSPSHQDDNNSCHIKRTNDSNIHVMAVKLKAPEKNDTVLSTDQYLFEVAWENNEVTHVKKNFAEMCEFHEKLIGRITRDERNFDVQLPDIDADHLSCVEEASDGVWVSLVKFVSFLTHLPLHILHSEEVTQFFSRGAAKPVIGQPDEPQLLHEANNVLMPTIEREAAMPLSQQPALPGDCGPSHSTRSSSCGSQNNYSLLSLNSSIDMPRHSSTGSSPLSTPPSSSDGCNAPRLREDAFTKEKFDAVIGLAEDTKRLHLNDGNDSFKTGHVYHTDSKRPWLNRNSGSCSNHKSFLSMGSPDDVSFSSRDVLTNPPASKSVCPSTVISSSLSTATSYHQRLAVWLKANRMHKYLDRLCKYSYEELLLLDRPILQQEGFTLGAINKLMGMLEELKRNPDSFNSPVSVASASHRCSSESSKSVSSSEASIAGCGGSNNISPVMSAPGSPTPISQAVLVNASNEQGASACAENSKATEAEKENDERIHMTDVGIETSLPDDENDLDPKNGFDGHGSDIATSCNDVFETMGPLSPVIGEAPPTPIPPLIMPTVPSVHQPQMMIMYPGPSNFYYASPLHLTSPQHQQQSMGSSMMSSIGSSGDFSNSGSASRPPGNSGHYYYYALPGPTPVQNIMPMAPPSRSRQHPVAAATVSSPQPSPVVPGQTVSTGASAVTPGMLLLRPGSTVQTNSSLYCCTCTMCQQQQTSNSQSQPAQHQTHPQSSQVNVSSIVVPQSQPPPPHQHSQQQRAQQPPPPPPPPPQPQPSQHLPHRPNQQESQAPKNQQQQQQPQQPAYYWQNGITYACSNVSYPCCVPPGAPVQPPPVAEPAVTGFVPQPGAPLIPYPGQNNYYPSHVGFGAGGYYYPPMHPSHQFGPFPGQRRQRTCYNCGVAGHKSAECQEKTIDTLMSDNYFHLKYQPTEYGMLHSTNPGLNTASVGGPSVSVEP